MPESRIGFGTDSHRFKNPYQKSEKLNSFVFLGGVRVQAHSEVEANSDGDVVLHALCNALSLAIGKGDLSRYSDRLLKEQNIRDSAKYLEFSYHEVLKEGFVLGNCTVMIECIFPKINPLIEPMKINILKILNECHSKEKIGHELLLKHIGIGATSGEALSDFGKGLGIYCSAIVSLIEHDSLKSVSEA